MSTESINKLGRWFFAVSLIAGTAIFVINLLTNYSEYLIWGFLFLIIALIANSVLLLVILYHARSNKSERKKLLRSSGLMLLNIPIAYLYIYITNLLMNMMIITFVNASENNLTEIIVTGCETKSIQKLAPSEKETVWFHINSDCHIDISYNLNGVRKSENVVGYATPGLGKRTKFLIGKD